MKPILQESSENYLEAILQLTLQGKRVRAVNIANSLNFTRPSVSIALKKLRESGFIEVDKDGYIVFTDKGQEVANSVYERHVFLSDWLITLGVDKDNAVNDACKMEHILSEQSFSAIKKYVEGLRRG